MPGKNDTPESHLPLHPLELQILLSLVSGPAHAYAIVRSIEARQPEWNRILPTNMYRRIWRLETKELIVLDRVIQETDRARKQFSITSLGRKVAQAETLRLRALLQEAESMLPLEPVEGGSS